MTIDLLREIAPAASLSETVDVRGIKLTIRPFTAQDMAAINARFPGLLAGTAASDDTLMRRAMAIIAAGLGAPGDEAVEHDIGERLTLGEQTRVMNAILRLSGFDDAGPFVPGNGAAGPPAISATTSPRRSKS